MIKDGIVARLATSPVVRDPSRRRPRTLSKNGNNTIRKILIRSYKLNKLGLDKIIDKEMESLNKLRKMIRKTQRDIDKLERMRGM